MATVNTVTSTTSVAATTRNPMALVRSIVVTGLFIGVVGSVDFATFFYLTLHMPPIAVFQYVASGLLGPSAFAGGYATALLGILIHFVIAFVVAAVFILAANQMVFLRRTAWVFVAGLVYGAAVNMVMSMAVLPYSAAPRMQVTATLIVHGLIADALIVGLPVAFAVWYTARANKASVAA
ncbi:MAG: hypothetical protein ABI068_11185 [Ktedonobacterales bacterium]